METNSKISLLVPTRHRANRLLQMWQSAQNTSSNKENLELIIAIDDDDKESCECLGNINDSRVKSIIKPRSKNLSKMWNDCYDISSGNILMHAGDDIIFRTQNWDKAVVDAINSFDDHIILVYSRDGIQNEALGTHSFLHRQWVEIVGYFVPPYFAADFNDTWLNEVAQRINRRKYLPDVYIEHMHFGANKSQIDDVYQERRDMYYSENCNQVYCNTENKRIEAAKMLSSFIKEFASKKNGVI